VIRKNDDDNNNENDRKERHVLKVK